MLTGVHTMTFQNGKVRFSVREAKVAVLVCQGRSNQEIASALKISKDTVKQNLHAIFRALKLRSRLELCVYGLQHPRAIYPPPCGIGHQPWTEIRKHPLGCDCGAVYCEAMKMATALE